VKHFRWFCHESAAESRKRAAAVAENFAASGSSMRFSPGGWTFCGVIASSAARERVVKNTASECEQQGRRSLPIRLLE
jgi:hypothetical protein